MNSPYIHERRRIMDPAKKVKFSQLVRESHSLEEAAEWLDVSIRTVQRERRRDEDFDHEIRLGLAGDARSLAPHGKRRANPLARRRLAPGTNAPRAVRPETGQHSPRLPGRSRTRHAPRSRLSRDGASRARRVLPTGGARLRPSPPVLLPQLGPNGNLKKSKLPPTPLTNETSREAHREAIAASMAQAQAAAASGEQPAEWFTAPGWFNEQPASPLSPKTAEATPSDATPAPRSHAPRGNATPDAPRRAPRHDAAPALPQLAGQEAGSTLDAERREERSHAERGNENADDHLSPKTPEATADDTTAVVPEPTLAIDYNLPIDFNLSHDDFAHAIAARDPKEQAVLWDQRLRHWGEFKRRREAQLSRTTRPATKRRNAA